MRSPTKVIRGSAAYSSWKTSMGSKRDWAAAGAAARSGISAIAVDKTADWAVDCVEAGVLLVIVSMISCAGSVGRIGDLKLS